MLSYEGLTPADAAREILAELNPPQGQYNLGDLLSRLSGSISIERVKLDGDGYLIDLGEAGAQIFVNSKRPRERQRFTEAHELGHWLLQHRTADAGLNAFVDHDATLERWCDSFAAHLLLPAEWVNADIQTTTIEGAARLLWSWPSKYGISMTVARLRFVEEVRSTVFDLRTRREHVTISRSAASETMAATLSKQLRVWAVELAKMGARGRHEHPEFPISASVDRRLVSTGDERVLVVCVAASERRRFASP